MEVIDVSYEPPHNSDPLVLCIGKFDGVHIGHHHLLNVASTFIQTNERLSVISFSPHPLWVLKGDSKYKNSLTPMEEKSRVLEQYGVKKFYRIHFTKEYAKTEVDTFVFKHLSKLNLRRIVVGEDFNFGKDYDSGTNVLKDLCGNIGVPVSVVPVLKNDGFKISSTEIRQSISEGKMEKANLLLGRPYKIAGTINSSHFSRLEINLPADHFDNETEYVLPKTGVYEMKIECHRSIHHQEQRSVFASGKGFCSEEHPDRYVIDFIQHINRQDFSAGQSISVTFLRRSKDYPITHE